MTTADDRERHDAAWNAEANDPRAGWSRIRSAPEFWLRDHCGFRGIVYGLGDSDGAGAWNFVVVNGDEAIAQGESSRRGFAMDGADAAMPTPH